MRTLIVEDEPSVRATIRELVKLYCPRLHVVGEAGSVQEAAQAVAHDAPDLLLLDIELGDGTAFDLLRRWESPPFQVLFITAHAHYAIDALRMGACDYLLKPVSADDLVSATERARRAHERNEHAHITVAAQHHRGERDRIVLRDLEHLHVVAIKDIIRCVSDGRYTSFHFVNGRPPFTVSVHLKEYERSLTQAGFMRVHRSHLVNLAHVQRVDKRDLMVHLIDGHAVPVSIRRREQLFAVL